MTRPSEPPFHARLVKALEPIRQGFLAQVILGLFDSGIYEALTARPQPCAALSEALGLRPDRVEALLAYGANEGLVELSNNGDVSVTPLLDEYADFHPWYRLLVGGYHATLAEMPALLSGEEERYGARNLPQVGLGSSGVSQHDTIPVVRSLVRSLREPIDLIVDLGCADASYLVDLCQNGYADRGVGVDATPESCARAMLSVAEAGLDDRISVVNTMAQEYLARQRAPTSCYIAAFLLQELLAQEGWGFVESLLRRLASEDSRPRLIVIEVDYAVDDGRLSDGLGRAYYNPYFLVHAFTRQQLLSRRDWEKLFAGCGWSVVATAHPPEGVDPTLLEIGFLLEPSTRTMCAPRTQAR